MRIKNVLKDLRFYLSGPIENTKDDGVDWRKKFTDLAKESIRQSINSKDSAVSSSNLPANDLPTPAFPDKRNR